MKLRMRLVAVTTLALVRLGAQDISGDWQGTLKTGPRELRLILHVARFEDGQWKAMLLSIDQSPDRGVGLDASSFTFSGSDLKFVVSSIGGRYEGRLSTDGKSIAGTWTQATPLPLEFYRPTKDTAWRDLSPHRVQFVEVEKGVSLEVLDWGGSGRPLILLAGLGNSAHVFDTFALRLAATCHVYGITRRGFGASSAPSPSRDAAYSADRLGDDVLVVSDALRLRRPVLAGHSIAGEELSSVGSRFPEKVAGLIYLDAAYAPAYYDRAHGNFGIDLLELERNLRALEPGNSPANRTQLLQNLAATTLPAFERALKEEVETSSDQRASGPSGPQLSPVRAAVLRGVQKFTELHVPVLAIYATPSAAAGPRDETTVNSQAKALKAGVPSARIVRLPHASHYVFLSNRDEVLREMTSFIAGLR